MKTNTNLKLLNVIFLIFCILIVYLAHVQSEAKMILICLRTEVNNTTATTNNITLISSKLVINYIIQHITVITTINKQHNWHRYTIYIFFLCVSVYTPLTKGIDI